MLKGSYSMVFKKINEVRGITLDDTPSNWTEIMQAFDNIQNARRNGVQIAYEIIKKTELWLNVIKSIVGTEGAKYIVASNKIATTCLEIITDYVCDACKKAYKSDLEPDKRLDLYKRLKGIADLLKCLEGLYMIPEVRKTHKDMVEKLAIAEKQLNTAVSSS